MSWINEFEDGEMPLHKAIQKLRDEVTGYTMGTYSGRNRELALVMTHLDDAYHWAVAHGVANGKLAVVDRAQVLKAAAFAAAEAQREE